MTRRSSVRAQARRNYKSLQQTTPTPDPSPQGGGEKKETKLTKRVRALYEDSAVPVREIAAAAGVTERTLYNYVEKHNWKRRYRVLPRGEAAAASNRGRRWRSSPGFAPVKGAGARFIRREDQHKPIAVGLKATDPAGAARAVAHCDAAAQRGAVALAEAEEQRMADERASIWQFINTQLAKLERHLAESGSQPLGSAAPDVMRDVYMRNVTWGCEVLEDLRQARANYRGPMGTS